MSHTVSIDDQMAWVVTDQATGRTRTFQSKQAAEMHLDWQENGLPRQTERTRFHWKAILLWPLAAVGL